MPPDPRRHRPRSRLAAVALVAAAAAVPLVVPPPALAAMTSANGVRLNTFEARLVTDINAARRAAGLAALVVTPGTTDVARSWSWQMAAAARLAHNPALVGDLAASGSGGWTAIAENVGYGPAGSPDSLFRAYMNSAGHRANILDRSMRYLGVGTVEASASGVAYAWNTLDFTNAYAPAYGPTRQPAAGMHLDAVAVTSTRDLASFESGFDQRFRTQQAGGVQAGALRVDPPSRADDALHFTVRQVSPTSGRGELVMRDALDLRRARSVSFRVAVSDPAGRPVAAEVLVQTPFAPAPWTVSVGWVTIPTGGGWVSATLPASARTLRTQHVLRLATTAIVAVGRSATVHVYDVRVTV